MPRPDVEVWVGSAGWQRVVHCNNCKQSNNFGKPTNSRPAAQREEKINGNEQKLGEKRATKPKPTDMDRDNRITGKDRAQLSKNSIHVCVHLVNISLFCCSVQVYPGVICFVTRQTEVLVCVKFAVFFICYLSFFICAAFH